MNHLKETILLVSLFLMNAAGFLVMFIDKQKARRGRWRIPERTLLLLAALGGSVGSLLGMYLFHHKTKHLKFTLGIPLILILQLLLAWLLCPLQTTIPLPAGQAAGRGIDSALNSSCPYDRLGQPETVKCIENTWDMAWTK